MIFPAHRDNKAVMAGLVPAILELHEPIVEIVPVGIGREDQAHLPSTRPMLHVLLAPNGRPYVSVWLGIDQALQAVALGEAADQTFPMLPSAMPNMSGDACVQDAIRPVGHHVQPSGSHPEMLAITSRDSNIFVDGRDKPGHDDEGVAIRGSGAVCIAVLR